MVIIMILISLKKNFDLIWLRGYNQIKSNQIKSFDTLFLSICLFERKYLRIPTATKTQA
jgi:hypothetical protein